MSLLLILFALVVVALWWRQQRRHHALLKQIAAMVEVIKEGGRPASFILHGKEACHIGLGLEWLADERDRLTQRISQEGLNSEAVLSSMTEGVMILDAERKVRLVNLSCRKLFALSNSPLGKSVLQVIRERALDELVAQALSRGEAQNGELVMPLSGMRIEMSASPIRNEQGAALGVAAIFRDVTRMRQLEEIRREFVANVSHELRTPLSIFQGYLEILIDQPDLSPEERLKTLRILERHSARLNLLVEDLLLLAKMEARQEVFTREAVAVDELLKGVEQDWCIPFAKHEVRFELEVAPALPPAFADAERMVQVMNNLLENALKYTDPGGVVTVSAAAAEGEIELRVRDSGRGIPPADLPHIFERFYRADKARSRSLGGTGLGLSIVKHSIASQGGRVWVESEPGAGTTFFLRLPCSPDKPSLQAREGLPDFGFRAGIAVAPTGKGG